MPGFVKAILAVLVLLVLFFLLLPGNTPPSSETSRRNACYYQFRHFGIALQNYHDAHKTFPPAYLADADGKPLHSWRVLLLPYFEEAELHKLAEKYRFDEPWNGPHNRILAAQAPDIFRCPSDADHPGDTNYVAVVGDPTVWPGVSAMTLKGIGDGADKTIMVVETFESGINWLEPRDIPIARAMRGINPSEVHPSISSNHRGGANVLFSNGVVRFLENDITAEILYSLLTPNGGEQLIMDKEYKFKLLSTGQP